MPSVWFKFYLPERDIYLELFEFLYKKDLSHLS